MKLDKHIVDMFTELTKPADDVKMEKTCYGTISVVDGTRYVKLDGSDLLVPAASTVKTSHGDRVTVLMKNHSLTVTGNLTAPATDGEGGSSGEAGTAATIEVGTVTTGEAGSSAAVTNVGTTSAAVFDFVIPRGDKGEKGDTGPQGPQGEKGDTGTWDGTIPDHEHTVSDITDFPASLPANGGNADTLDGLHASDFYQAAVGLRTIASYSDIFSTTLSESHACWNKWCFVVGSSNDSSSSDYIDNAPETTVALWYEVFTGGVGNRAFQIAIGCYTHQRKTFIRYMHDWVWSGWHNIADGGNADTLDRLHASDFYQVASGLRTEAVYYDIFSTTLSSSHACWNKWCIVMGNSTDISTSDYIDNAPESYDALWYEVFTGGDRNRSFQIAIGCFQWQNNTFIRYQHDGNWSGWKNIADGGNADTLDRKHANEFASVRKITTQAEVDGFLESGIYSVENVGTHFGSNDSSYYMLIVNRHRPDRNYNSELAIPYESGLQKGVYYRNCADGTWGAWTNVADGGNADTLDRKHADEFLYADGFAGQLAKLFSQPANDTELATVFSVAPDDATLDTLNPGIYVVNTSAARRSLSIPNEIIMGGPNGATVDNSQCTGGILIKLGSILGKPGFYTTAVGQAVDRPYTTSCAFFISNNGSIYRAIESINQGADHTGAYMYAEWKWKAFVFDLFSNTDAYTIQSIQYINIDVTLAPGKTYTMYTTVGQFALPYTRGTAYGPTKSFPLKSSSSNPNLCIINTSSTENLIIPAGRYLIHAR